ELASGPVAVEDRPRAGKWAAGAFGPGGGLAGGRGFEARLSGRRSAGRGLAKARRMKLYQSPNSPFVRKVLVTAIELGLDDRIERIAATPHPIRRNMELVALNPLGQIPTLVIDGGERISDSRVICEYLASLAPGQKMFPAGPRRWAALTEQSICDGL